MSDDASREADSGTGINAAELRSSKDWKVWHATYDDPDSPLVRRLAVVRDRIRVALDTAPPGPIKILSLCSGEGRDLLPVLAAHPRRGDATARLVEFEPGIAEVARDAAAELGLTGVEVVTGDAALLDHYRDLAPARLVLLCGIFGNIPDEDIRTTVAAAAMLTARGGTVIWTRHRREPDLLPTISGWFAEHGFTELWRSGSEVPEAVGVAAHRLDRDPDTFAADGRLFTFRQSFWS